MSPTPVPGKGRQLLTTLIGGNPLQYSCRENSMDRGAWQATVHGAAKSRTRLSDFTFFLFFSIRGEGTDFFLCIMGLPWGRVVKNPPANAGDVGFIPGLGRYQAPQLLSMCSVAHAMQLLKPRSSRA